MKIRDVEYYLTDALRGYLTAALWTEIHFCEPCGDAGTVVDGCESGEDLTCGSSLQDNGFTADDDIIGDPETDLVDFILANWNDLNDMDAVQAGHDFWLTRNHHGVGFWDRGLGERGDRLAEACRPYGEASVYLGDNGKLYYQD